jgi:WD40 repeat protein/serine/threonine protein kinase
MNDQQNNACQECGAIIPEGGPAGLCAPCLLKLGLERSNAPETAGRTATEETLPEHAGLDARTKLAPSAPWRSAAPGAEPAPVIEQTGDQIGRYKLLQKIGEGGCGVVYMAEQEEPVHRRVALKVIKLGMDTKQVVARFGAERQALALMDHPNIAKVLDAGATETGRPYFVMELVRGIRITDYCDQNNVPTGERLKLFAQVCQAIQHAHQKGVIHRDIKPSNILVTLHDGVPVPKVIDFGIAKATQGRLTDQTLFTAFEQFIGTPAYMSPEQAEMSGLDIDTRSDIYSLGVLLYELLVGTTPFGAEELMAAGLDQMRRTIREQEPVRPSTRLNTMVEGELTTMAKHRQTDALRLIHLVRGDLDWIVMKCLEKDRTRRYETANGLAADIERHLSNEPVVACPPSKAYRFQKFVRRNKVMVTSGALIATVLVLGVLTSTWLAVQATRAKREQIRLRGQSQAEERKARLRAYASEVSVALQAWESGNPSRARALLERQRPKPDEEDLRGFEWRYLYGLSRTQEIATLHLQSGAREVWGSAWSPDGKYVALGSYGAKVELWDWAARKRLETIPSRDLVYSLAFSPDGSKLAYPIQAGVALWDLDTHRIADQYTGKPEDPPLLALSHDGRLLAYVSSGGYNTAYRGRIAICDLTKQSAPFELVGHEASSFAPDFSPDDRWLVTPHGDGAVILWDLEHRTIQDRLIGHRGLVFVAKFSPDGGTLATGGIDGSVRLWDLRDTPGQRRSFILGTHKSTVFSLGFSPNRNLLVSASLDHTAKVWDLAESKEIETLRGHDQRIFSASFSPPDGRFIMTGSEDSSVKIWRTPEAPPDKPLDTHTSDQYRTLEFSPDGRWLLAGEADHTKLWGVASKRKVVLDLIRCRFSPDTNTLAGLSTNGQLTLWSVSNQQPRPIMTLTDTPPFRLDVNLAFTPDGRTLAGAKTNGDLTLWSLIGDVPRLVRTLTHAAASEGDPLFAPGGQLLAIQSDTNAVAIWNWVEGRQIKSLREEVPPKLIKAYSFSPNGRTFLTRYKDDTMRFWETAGWIKGDLLTANPYGLHAFSADSRWLAAGQGFFAKVSLWDMARQAVEELSSGSGPVDCLAFSPEGRTLAVGTRDGWVNLWHLPSRQEIISLKAHRSHVWRAVFSPDGRTLATAGADGTLRLWTAPTLAETDASTDRLEAQEGRR